MRQVPNGRRCKQHDRQHHDPGDKARLQPMGYEGPRRNEREARDTRRNRTGKARLNDAIDKMAEPARYSQHTNLRKDD